MNVMNKAFFGTFISHAQNELIRVTPLLARASNQFLTEKSIDEAIEHLHRSREHLLKAKQSYLCFTHHPQDHRSDRPNHPAPPLPHTQSHLS